MTITDATRLPHARLGALADQLLAIADALPAEADAHAVRLDRLVASCRRFQLRMQAGMLGLGIAGRLVDAIECEAHLVLADLRGAGFTPRTVQARAVLS